MWLSGHRYPKLPSRRKLNRFYLFAFFSAHADYLAPMLTYLKMHLTRYMRGDQ